MSPNRRGGHASTGAGGRLTWSEAAGARGTRWREAIERDGALVRAVLLEVSPGGRPTRLEITTAHGLLTLHPEPDESALHGNVVGPDGVRHLAFDWSPTHELLVLESPAAAAATLGRLTGVMSVGEGITLDMLRIDDDLDPRPVRWDMTRTADRAWHLRADDGTEERRFTVDVRGYPTPPGAITWPLEA